MRYILIILLMLSILSIGCASEVIADTIIETTTTQENIPDFDRLLRNVYYGKNDSFEFTGFSFEYRGKFYLVTAGHCASGNPKNIFYNDYARYEPELIFIDEVIDYAIYIDDSLKSGLKVWNGNFDTLGITKYVLLKGNKYRKFEGKNVGGESGSPVIDSNGDVISYVIAEVGTGSIGNILITIDNF